MAGRTISKFHKMIDDCIISSSHIFLQQIHLMYCIVLYLGSKMNENSDDKNTEIDVPCFLKEDLGMFLNCF